MRQALAESINATTNSSKKRAVGSSSSSSSSNGKQQQQQQSNDDSNDDNNDMPVGIAKGGHVVNRVKPGIVMENDAEIDDDASDNGSDFNSSNDKVSGVTIHIHMHRYYYCVMCFTCNHCELWFELQCNDAELIGHRFTNTYIHECVLLLVQTQCVTTSAWPL
jgi:hypothetical protein